MLLSSAMKQILVFLLVLPLTMWAADGNMPDFDDKIAARFAQLALACVDKEYPNHISHTLSSESDVASPCQLTPAFCGCYDWHSSVHGHWLLARLSRTYPKAPFAADARKALQQSLTAAKIKQEATYLAAKGRSSFERPYGLAWLLQLCAELHEWDDPMAHQLSENLQPLERAAVQRLSSWLPKLSDPVRIGEHDQTAFALGLMLDYARAVGNADFEKIAADAARRFFFDDKDGPLSYEPSGEDFLSPCLAEADVMRRILSSDEFATWLSRFLPQIPTNAGSPWLAPVISPDPSDPKLAHLDGLNLSRAWMLEGIASGLPANDSRRPALEAAAATHAKAGLAAVTGEHYEGGHWLGSFAAYLTTRRGIPSSNASSGAKR